MNIVKKLPWLGILRGLSHGRISAMLAYLPFRVWGEVLRRVRDSLGVRVPVRSVDALIHRARADASWKRLEAETAALSGQAGDDPFGPLKYLALDYWLRTSAESVVRLGLVGREPMRILDLGTGGGLFPFLCCVCGHRGEALDVPLEEFDTEERLVYLTMAESLNVRPIRQRIEAFTPLVLDGSYDPITAFMVCFNEHKQPGEWGRAEWTFFLRDIHTRLRPGGRLFMRLNDHSERYGALRYFSPEMRALFAEAGEVDDTGAVTVYRDRLDRLVVVGD